MGEQEIRNALQGFISEIKTCNAGEEARDVQHRIEEFYENHEVPDAIDDLAKSGFCEMLAMLADAYM